MSIKMLAQDLYRYQREVARLEKELTGSPLEKRTRLEAELRQAVQDRDYLRRALDGKLEK